MNIKLLDNESVWHNLQQQNKCRSQWPILYGPVIMSPTEEEGDSDILFLEHMW